MMNGDDRCLFWKRILDQRPSEIVMVGFFFFRLQIHDGSIRQDASVGDHLHPLSIDTRLLLKPG